MNDHLQWRVGSKCQLAISIFNPLEVELLVTRIELDIVCHERRAIQVDEKQTVRLLPLTQTELRVTLVPSGFAVGFINIKAVTFTLFGCIRNRIGITSRGLPGPVAYPRCLQAFVTPGNLKKPYFVDLSSI